MQGIYDLLFSGQAANMELAYLLAESQGWSTVQMKRRLQACMALMERAHRLPLTPLRFVELLRDNGYGLPLNARKLKELPEELDFLAPVLLSLELNDNHLEEIPEVIFRLNRLQKFYIANNPIYELPPALWDMACLEALDISYTSIDELPEQIGRLERLRELFLERAPLKYLPRALANLPLERLSYGMNQGYDLPEVLYDCTRLVWLRLVGFGLHRLPADIARWQALEELELHGTRLQELPEALGRLGRLRRLHLFHVPLRALPQSIGQLKNLETIYLKACPTAVFPDALAQLPRLQKITVEHLNASPQYWTGPYPLCEQRDRIRRAAPQAQVEVLF